MPIWLDATIWFAVNHFEFVANFLARLSAQIVLSASSYTKCAAADLDSLKCEQLQNQSRLIHVQEDLNVKKSVQLESVEKTVDDKLSTWSSVVAKNCEKKVTQKEMKKVVKLAMNEQDRQRNVIMFNVPERDIQDKNEHHDGKLAFKIMQQARLSEQDGQYNCKRLGAPESSRIRPQWIQFSSRSNAFELLVKSKNLKDSDQYSNIFIVPDRTLQERIEHKKLVNS